MKHYLFFLAAILIPAALFIVVVAFKNYRAWRAWQNEYQFQGTRLRNERIQREAALPRRRRSDDAV